MRRKKFLSLLVTAVMATSLAACGGSTGEGTASENGLESKSAEASGQESGDVVVLNYPTFQVGANTAAPVVAELVKQFNEKYAGKYEIKVEDVPGDQDYADKMKVMMTSGELPPVIYGGGQKILDLAIEAGQVVDLTDAVNGDADWKAMYSDGWNMVNARDGKIYASSQEAEKIGYFYNKELYDQVGIKPAATWEEFFDNCDKLSAAGITPLSMDTADGGWCTQLLMGALIATSSEDGLKFMNTVYPTDYNTPEMIDAATKVQELFTSATTADAVGGAYENAANNFFSGNTAMICNGPWMIGDFSDSSKCPEGFADKVGVATYPGGFVYDSPIEGYFVTKQSDPKVEEAAIEMVKFFTSADAQKLALETQGMVPAAATVEITDVAKKSFPLMADFLDQASACDKSSSTLTGNMVAGLMDTFSAELPNLATGVDTPEQFCQVLTDFATANAAAE